MGAQFHYCMITVSESTYNLILIIKQRGTEFGELMFSLSYLPTAERLTAVVVKARNLKFQNDKTVGDSFVKVMYYTIFASYVVLDACRALLNRNKNIK